MGSPTSAGLYQSVLDMIGQTPMLAVSRLDTGPCSLFLKIESDNPGNSIKDRIALSMIESAEKSGQLRKGGRIVEATAGNTGIALALVATLKGYRVSVVMPDKMSDEKISHLRAMGAEVILTRSDVAKGHPEYYQDMAKRLADSDPTAFYVNQFGNEANPDAHFATTGPEIWEQMDGKVDAFVAGVGSGGTVSGVGRYLRSKNPHVEIVLADPAGSILAPLVNEGRTIEPGAWLVEGIGEDFVPSILELSLVNKAYAITDAESFSAARELLRREGVLGGSSTGTLLAAALKYCREQTSPKRVVTFVCDTGAKYLSKMFSDYWMVDQGFIKRPQSGDLRDLIARRHDAQEDFTLSPSLPVGQAIKRMRMYSVSQMVVLDSADKVAGIIDEGDVLMALVNDRQAAKRPVSDFMVTKVETLPPTARIEDVLPILRADRVAVIADGERYWGLVTKIDLINWMRSHLP